MVNDKFEAANSSNTKDNLPQNEKSELELYLELIQRLGYAPADDD